MCMRAMAASGALRLRAARRGVAVLCFLLPQFPAARSRPSNLPAGLRCGHDVWLPIRLFGAGAQRAHGALVVVCPHGSHAERVAPRAAHVKQMDILRMCRRHIVVLLGACANDVLVCARDAVADTACVPVLHDGAWACWRARGADAVAASTGGSTGFLCQTQQRRA
jgi:hypothetical protein